MIKHDLVIIGGGPAGLAAAISAYDEGIRDILIIEREDKLGGILKQCIHNGFGLKRFSESLTGPEYALRFIDRVKNRNIGFLLNSTVISLSKDKIVTVVNGKDGICNIEAKAVILAMGCRERSRGALNIAGTRPAGIYSAGTAQKYVNVKGYIPGKNVVILGSGDIGLIMARRMTLEGAKVHAVCEIMPYSLGLKRNIEQCLNNFDIPLYLNHTITKIEGEKRVTGVVVSKVDENKMPVKGTEIHFDCDTVLFSVGLIPENELSKNAGIKLSPRTKGAVVDENRATSLEGVFACGNVLHVHDLVDFVSEEAELAGVSAAKYILSGKNDYPRISVMAGMGINYVLPQKISNIDRKIKIYFRVTGEFRNCKIKVLGDNGEELFYKKKNIAVPGEMETLTLSPELLGKVKKSVKIVLEEEIYNG